MPRAIWKGAISFGLVHVPVALYPAAREGGIDFDWLDKRNMARVGYKRVNKKTGKEVRKEHIVKGVKLDSGEYVVLGEDEIRAAYPKTTQTIAIESFVQAAEVSFMQLEKPYFLEPAGRGEKVYALLREAMLDAGVIGIARVVMHTKEHLAALIPDGPALMLNTLRWGSEIRSAKGLELPAAGRKQVKPAELKMARKLIEDMTTGWDPGDYADRFSGAIEALVDQRARAGKTETIEPLEEAGADAGESSNVVDLTALLKQSLAGGGKEAARKQPAQGKKTRSASGSGRRAAGSSASARKAAPRKRA